MSQPKHLSADSTHPVVGSAFGQPHLPAHWAVAMEPQTASQHAGQPSVVAEDGTPAQPIPATLQARLDRTFSEGIHGLCFSPYLNGQSPGSPISAEQIHARMALISPHTRWVRTFSCTDGMELIPEIAHEHGLKTLVGAWLGTDNEINERELEGVIAVARAGHADLVAVGNEVLLREDMDEDALLAYIQRVKDALPGVKVGYVDAYYLFELHPRIVQVCDVLMANCYPFWEGCPLEHALTYMQSMYTRTVAVAQDKPVQRRETGCPHQGSSFGGAIPSPEGAVRYFVDSLAWSRDVGIDLFYFSAFDEAWKVGTEGDVGAYWGLWNTNGQPKFSLNPNT